MRHPALTSRQNDLLILAAAVYAESLKASLLMVEGPETAKQIKENMHDLLCAVDALKEVQPLRRLKTAT